MYIATAEADAAMQKIDLEVADQKLRRFAAFSRSAAQHIFYPSDGFSNIEWHPDEVVGTSGERLDHGVLVVTV